MQFLKYPIDPVKIYLGRMRAKQHCPPRVSMRKIGWSWAASFLGISFIALVTSYFGTRSALLIGSFGASAVLVYGAPLAEFSQPRNLVGGHVLSSFIGICMYKLLGFAPEMACALAVSFSIASMQFTRTMHPPGGATALTAVIGGDKIHSLGFGFMVIPVLMGAVVLLAVALLMNNLSRNPKRHYPAYWY
ncbi:MAG: HPP family protein [Brachymonas sp.]|nr:HPP family protein [Brachymonas sp.]